MQTRFKLIPLATLVMALAACQTTGSATTPPAATAGPATAGASTTAPTTAPSMGLPSGAVVVFESTPGGSTTVQGGATLVSAGGQTQVVIAVTSSSPDAMAAAIQKGTCDNRTPEIAYRLTDVVTGASTTTVAADLATLLATPHVINIIVKGSETESSIACGEITAG
jgi:hypothetical protein